MTVVDRDELPEASTHRRGVPQAATMSTGCWRAGSRPWRSCSPGSPRSWSPHGVPAGDLLADARLYLSGHRLRQAHTGLVVLCASRPVLEGHMRARVRALPNVGFLDRRDIVGLATTPDGRRVIGVRVLRRADGSAEEVLGADLVVDATGRGSRTPVWLDALGYARPASRSRYGSGWGTRLGPTGSGATPSAATWRF